MTSHRLDSSRHGLGRVECTTGARVLIALMRQQHGALVFHQSGGCCDGSAPMLFPKNEFFIDGNDVFLGYVGGIPFYMSADQFEYMRFSKITIDISDGRGSSFSVEAPTGKRFISNSRLFTDKELERVVQVA